MLVVPETTGFLAEARVRQADIDKLYPGQTVVLKLSSLDPRVTPDLQGVVKFISPDLIRDQGTGQAYYEMRITVSEAETAKLPKGTRLVPGMPVETFAQTGERTVLSYLLQPVTEQFSRVFTER